MRSKSKVIRRLFSLVVNILAVMLFPRKNRGKLLDISQLLYEVSSVE